MAAAIVSTGTQAASADRYRSAQSGMGLHAVRAASALRRAASQPVPDADRDEFRFILGGIVGAAEATRRAVPADVRKIQPDATRERASVEGVRLIVDAISRARGEFSEDSLLALLQDLVAVISGHTASQPDDLLRYLDSLAASSVLQRPSSGDVVVRGRRRTARTV